jgi:hypothetical protein
MTDARHQFANDERGPAIGEYFGGAGDGTVLAVFGHGLLSRRLLFPASPEIEPVSVPSSN